MINNNGFANFLGRDNVLINVDRDGYDGYLRGREERKKQKDKFNQINTMNEDIADLKVRFSRIEELLLQVLEKNK